MYNDITNVYYRHNHFSEVSQLYPQKILFYDLTIVLKGSMIYYVNNKQITVKEGSILFLQHGALRARKNTTFAEYISFNFKCKQKFDKIQTVTQYALNDEILLLLKCYDLIEKKSFNSVNEKINKIIQLIMIELYDFYNKPQYNKLTYQIIDFLKENINKSITLRDIENKIYLTSCYFNKIFKKDTSYSVMQFFNNLKIEQAKMLLAEQALTLKQVSLNLGFNDYNYFSRLFTKIAKIPPIVYKNQFTSK